MITELERRALMGDPAAQRECTEKGIVLPCPKCYSEKLDIESDAQEIRDLETPEYLYITDASIVYITCTDCGICSECEGIEFGEECEDAEKRLIEKWNTRTPPPIGRCLDCEKQSFNENTGNTWCTLKKPRRKVNPLGFCSDFEPKEREENGNKEIIKSPRRLKG